MNIKDWKVGETVYTKHAHTHRPPNGLIQYCKYILLKTEGEKLTVDCTAYNGAINEVCYFETHLEFMEQLSQFHEIKVTKDEYKLAQI
jgi:hypothetical protein